MTISDLTDKINQFLDERNWQGNQKPKDLAISISLEAAEILEHFQWRNGKQIDEHLVSHHQDIADELADVAVYLFKLADVTKVDLSQAVVNKLAKAAKKYPVSAVKDNSDEYYRLKQAHRSKAKS